MSFLLEKAVWSSIFAVPSDIVDRHIKLCGETALKVLLVLLRHGGKVETEELARLLGRPQADILDAILYWQQAGVLSAEEQEGAPPEQRQEPVSTVLTEKTETVSALPAGPAVLKYTEIPNPAEDSPRERKVQTLSRSRGRLTTQEINQMAKVDEAIGYLLQESQSVLGRPLTPVATDTIVALYSYYGMQPDLVLMLLQYCFTVGKDNMRYVEKVAATWLEKGVDSHEKAEQEILRATQFTSVEHKVKSAFGIYDRKLVSSEQNYIGVWVNDFQFDLEMISLAFERAVEQKGKLSFPYINGILSNWYAKGIDSPAKALQEMQTKSKSGAYAGAQKQPSSKASYDIEEIKRRVTNQSLMDD